MPGSPSSPGGEAAGAPRGPSTTGDGVPGADTDGWQVWWGFNKDPYLNLKSALRTDGVVSGSDDFFIGRDRPDAARDRQPPGEQTIRLRVVPALIEALASERHNDVVTGCLIALAKIGETADEGGAPTVAPLLRARLADPSQEISETAAVALGILADEGSFATLEALALDLPLGRALAGASHVSARTRAFAAYGLGLIGSRTRSNDVRRSIAAALVDVLETTDTATRDLHVAAVIALGLVPVDPVEPDEPPQPFDAAAPVPDAAARVASRQGEIRFLLTLLAEASGHHALVRAHAPRALARLVEADAGVAAPSCDPALRDEVARALLAAVERRANEREEVVLGALLAMGQIADLDEDEVDVAMRAAMLERIDSSGGQLANRFALISLGQLCAREGSGEGARASYEAISGRLTRELGRSGGGTSRLRPWVGLALGVMLRARADASPPLPVSREVGQALRATLADCKVPADLGAYCIALGLARDLEAKPILLDKLESVADDEARGHAAVALGLMGASDRIETIRGLVEESTYRPDLLRQAAIALGLLGDKRLVPELVAMLADARSLSTQAAISSALGFIGDSRSIDPLVEMLRNKEITASARGFAAVALGIVADKEDLPWNSKISTDINYRANTTTLTGENGTGILDIL